VPYALLLPGLLWLVVFFVLPMVTLGSQSLQEGNVDDGYTFTGNCVDGTVSDASFMGISTHYLVQTAWGQELTVVQQNDGTARATLGETVTVSWAAALGFALDASQDAEAGAELVDEHG